MDTFLDQISIYNAKASLAITEAVKQENVEKANLMSALKSTANDLTLSTTTRLTALTALINIGDLLERALPPYFPLTVTYENLQKYAGIHNSLDGLDQGNYLHLTGQEKSTLFAKASVTDITWGNLQGDYTQNIPFAALFDQKQQQLNGVGFVRANGTNITYDNTTYLTTASLATTAAGGGLTGFYPNPGLSNSAVINQTLTGFNPLGPTGTITSADTIVSAIQKLNANLLDVGSGVGTISSISFTMPPNVFNYTAGPYTSGAAPLSATFKSQAQNSVFAGPTGGGTGQPDFRALVTADLPASPTPTGTFGSNITIPVITVDAYGRVTNIVNVTSASGGQVNTVTMAVPAGGVFTAVNGGTPSAVQLGFGLGNQSPNTVWAGPASGSSTAPGFRALVAADIPTGIPQANISNLTASLNSKLSTVLNTSLIYMGNGSGVAAQTVVSGDLGATYSDPSGVNTATFTIKNGAVTYAKFANVPDSALNTIRPILLGRFSAGQGVMEQMTLSGDFTLNPISGEIGLLTPNPPSLNDAGDLLTSSGANILERLSLPGDYATKGYLLVPYVGTTAPDIKLMWGEAKGDITYSIDTTTTPGTPFPNFVIGANKVTLGKIQTIATNTILGNNAVGASIPAELTPANVVAMLPLQDVATGTTKGVVPASSFTPASGKTKADYFLNANNGWSLGVGGATPPGGSAWQFQYNDNGTAFAGAANMVSNSSGDILVTTGKFGIVDSAASPTNGVYISASSVAAAGLIWNIPATTANDTFVGEAFAQTLTNKTLNSPIIGTGAGQGHLHLHTINNNPPSSPTADYITIFADDSPKRVGFQFGLDGFESYFQFSAASADKTYTFPNATGTVALIDSTQLLTVAASGGNSGKIALGGSTSGTITLQAPATVTGTGTYTMPDAYPTGANEFLTATTGGAMSWVSITGGGDVSSNTSSTTTGNFAVFADGSGKLIGEPSNASLSLSGIATFNGGVNIGVASSATGSIQFANTSTTFTTTISQPGTASANATYFWPTSSGSVSNVLTLGASGQLAWSASGSGDVTRAGTSQVITGSIIYQPNALQVRNAAQDRIVRLQALATGGAVGTWDASFQAASGTVPLLEQSQTFTAAQTFQANVTLGTGSYNATLLDFTGTTSNRIQFAAGPVGVPIAGVTAPVGTRITVASSRTNLLTDFTIGMASTTEMYLGSSGAANSEISMYNGTLKLGAFHVNGLGISRLVATGTGNAANSGQILINAGATSTTGIGSSLSFINFYTSVSTAPSVGNTRSTGTRIVLQPNIGVNSVDAAIGYNDTDKETWITGATTSGSSNGRISFYAGGISPTSFRRVGYFSGTGLVFDSPGTAAFAPITFNGTTINWINFGTLGSGAPSVGNTRSTGLKIALYSQISVNTTDYGIGVDTANYETWISGGSTASTNGGMIGFWVGLAGAYKRTVWITENALNLAAGTNIVTATTGTGGQIGTSTSQLVGFHGVAGTAQRAAAAQAAVATTAATQTTPWGYSTAAQADGVITLLNEIRTVLVNKGLMKGSA